MWKEALIFGRDRLLSLALTLSTKRLIPSVCIAYTMSRFVPLTLHGAFQQIEIEEAIDSHGKMELRMFGVTKVSYILLCAYRKLTLGFRTTTASWPILQASYLTFMLRNPEDSERRI